VSSAVVVQRLGGWGRDRRRACRPPGRAHGGADGL